MNLSKTLAQVIAYAMTFVATPTPYELGGDGSRPGQFMDCSRFTQLLMFFGGDENFPRTTWTQFADPSYPRVGPFRFGQVNPASIPAGAIVFLNVVGEDNNDPPQHVVFSLGGGQCVEAPFTGEDVKTEQIPNTASEFVYGWIMPVYVGASTAPPPASTPPTQPPATTQPAPQQQENVFMIPTGCTDNGAVQAQIKEWWDATRTDTLTPGILNLLMTCWAVGAGEPAPFGSTGFGRNPFLLISNIKDTVPAGHAINPGAV